MVNKCAGNIPNNRNRAAIIILILGCLLYFTNLGGWDLWQPDEPCFGQIEREMLKSGNYIIPHVNNKQRLYR